MTDSTPHPVSDELRTHATFLARISSRLTRDPSVADDVAQQTWLDFLERPPQQEFGRGWLFAATRNVARKLARSDTRRRRGEHRAARPETSPSAAELIERAHLRQELGRRVLELEEPYATTLLLRFYEGLPPRRVARLMDVPVETVRTRIRRGLDRLRARLDDERGRGRWITALLPLWWARSRTGSGASAKSARFLVSACCVIAALSVLRELIRPAPVDLGMASDPVGIAPPAIHPENRQQPTPITTRPFVRAPDPVARPAGTLVDLGGRPVRGVRVGWLLDGLDVERTAGRRRILDEPTTVTDAHGHVWLDRPASPTARLHVRDARWFPLGVGAGDDTTPTRLIIVPARRLDGTVHDDRGRALRGFVAVDPAPFALLDLSEQAAVRFQPFDRSAPAWMSAVSQPDATGRFRAHIPDLPDAVRVRASSPGYVSETVRAPRGGPAAFRLRRSAAAACVPVVVRGKVTAPDGSAVEGATVSFGAHHVRTDATGRYALRVPSGHGGGYALTARAGRHIAGRLDFHRQLRETAAATVEADLELTEPRGTLGGVIRDPSGRPLPGIRVQLVAHRGLLQLHDETMMVSDERGAFRFRDVPPGEAVLELTAGDLVTTTTKTVRPGDTDLALSLKVPEPRPTITVELRASDDSPVAGATVRTRLPGRPAQRRGRTDSAGRIALSGLSPHAWLEVLDTSPEHAFVGRRLPVATLTSPRAVIRVSRPRRVVARATERVRVLDAHGAAVPFVTHTWGWRCLTDRLTRFAGRRVEMEVGDDAHVLVLEDGAGRALETHPLTHGPETTLELVR